MPFMFDCYPEDNDEEEMIDDDMNQRNKEIEYEMMKEKRHLLEQYNSKMGVGFK